MQRAGQLVGAGQSVARTGGALLIGLAACKLGVFGFGGAHCSGRRRPLTASFKRAQFAAPSCTSAANQLVAVIHPPAPVEQLADLDPDMCIAAPLRPWPKVDHRTLMRTVLSLSTVA